MSKMTEVVFTTAPWADSPILEVQTAREAIDILADLASLLPY